MYSTGRTCLPTYNADLPPELGHQVEDGTAAIWNRHIRLQVTVGSPPAMLLSAKQGDDWVTVLKRVGGNTLLDSALRVSLPEQCALEVVCLSRSVCLVVRGTVPGGRLSIAAWLDVDASWLAVTETLNLDDRDGAPVAQMSAEWELVSFDAPGEVFSPHLTPEDDDIIGAHCLRSPALAAQDTRLAAALVQDVDSLEKQHLVPAFMSLLRRDGVPRLISGLVRQKVRDHVFFRATYEPVTLRELHHAYQLFVAVGREPGAALAEARGRIWEQFGKRRMSAARPPRAQASELAAEVYPRVMAEKWREGRIAGRRIGAITTDRAFPGDVWMCPWFHNLSTGYGLYAWGEKLGRSRLDRAIARHARAPLRRADGARALSHALRVRRRRTRWSLGRKPPSRRWARRSSRRRHVLHDVLAAPFRPRSRS